MSKLPNSVVISSTPAKNSGLVSSVDTGFWVDHNEPLEALAWALDKVHVVSPLASCMMAMNSFLFWTSDAVPDPGLDRCTKSMPCFTSLH